MYQELSPYRGVIRNSTYQFRFLLFGVQNPNAEMTRMKKDGYLIGSQRVRMAKILARINKYTNAETPADLPTKDILMTEYWVKS